MLRVLLAISYKGCWLGLKQEASDEEVSNFVNFAKGSAGDLRAQIYIGIDIGYIEKQIVHAWILEVPEISKMLSGLIRSVRNRGWR